MQPTITQQLPATGLSEESIIAWVNYQGLEFLRQVRASMNLEYHAQPRLSTDGTGTVTPIWTSADMPVGSVWAIDASAVIRATDSSGNDGRIDISALFSRQGGVSVQTGAPTTLVSVGPYLMTLTASGSGVLVNVQDDGVHACVWSVDIRVREVR